MPSFCDLVANLETFVIFCDYLLILDSRSKLLRFTRSTKLANQVLGAMGDGNWIN